MITRYERARESQRKYQQENKIKLRPTKARLQRKYAAARREECRQAVQQAKNKPCADCHTSYPHYIMDFDHVRGEKKFTVGTILARPDMYNLLAEIAKCDVVCANCHRERTHGK